MPAEEPRILAIDTGGTLTDTFVIDDTGRYTVGKAQSTPEDESNGITESFSNAVRYWDTTAEEAAPSLNLISYSGTAMLNRLLEREGNENIGVITTKGFEDTHRFGRGIQSWVEQSYAGRLHARTHEHPDPIVPKENIEGVRGRIDESGDELIALYEDEVRSAIQNLLDKNVEIVCVCLLFSYKNPEHEQRVQEIAEQVIQDEDEDTRIWLSSTQTPVHGELPRMNTLIAEAYAVDPSRDQLHDVRDRVQDLGTDAPMRILTGTGGTISPDHEWLVDTLISGPIGGIFGGEHLANELGISNLVCSDVGGTSFEVGLITKGHHPTRWDQSLAQMMLNIPITVMDTIGSGTGSYVRVDDATNQLNVGPESAGHLIGVSNTDSGLERPTVTDCSLILGYLNPDYFLGGDIPMDVDRAEEYVRDQIADPLGQDLYESARGVIDVVERNMTNELRAMILGQGFSPENYNLISYGGGGPLHAAGYSRPLNFKDILIPKWAAAFSAYGCACSDYSYRYSQTLELGVDPDFGNASDVASILTDELMDLKEQAMRAFERDGVDSSTVSFNPSVYMSFTGMLDDMKVDVPQELWDGGLDAEAVEQITDVYYEQFTDIYKRAATSPEKGYSVTKVVANCVAPSANPTLPDLELVGEAPDNDAEKASRTIYWEGDWHDAAVWDMGKIQPGNILNGPSIIEAPSTTVLVPPGFEASLDSRNIFHLSEEK